MAAVERREQGSITLVEENLSGATSEHACNEDKAPELPMWRFILLAISLYLGIFLSLLDTTIVATALYTIGVSLDSLNSVTWIVLAYTLSYLGSTVVFARVSDIAGRRNAYSGAFVIFFSCSLGCGFSQTLGQLIACRALQGVGGAGLYALAFVILSEVSPERFAKWVTAFSGVIIAAAGVLGPVLGGLITQYATWRWIFWINPLIGILPLVFLIVAWPKSDQMREIQRGSFKELDIVGGILITVASALVVFALEEAAFNHDAWAKPIVLSPLLGGCLCWALLVGWEAANAHLWKWGVKTMFPWRLFRRRVYMFHVLSMLLAGFPYFTIIYNLPLRLEIVSGRSPLMAGVSLLPMLGGVAVGSLLGGAVNGRNDRTFATLFIASLFTVTASALLSTLNNTLQVEPRMYAFQALFGLGFGLTGFVVTLGAELESEVLDSIAQGIIAQARVLGGSIGVAGSTVILRVTERSQLTGIVTPGQLTALRSTNSSLTAEQLQAVRHAYVDAFAETLRVCAIVAGVGVLVSLGVFRKTPPRISERRRQRVVDGQNRVKATK